MINWLVNLLGLLVIAAAVGSCSGATTTNGVEPAADHPTLEQIKRELVEPEKPIQQQQQAPENIDAGNGNSSNEQGADEEPRPRLYDFQSFKKVFHKHYGSLVEEMARAKLFVMRAMRVANAYMRFKLGYATSYLSLNQMSDWTQEERDMLKPKQDSFPVVNKPATPVSEIDDLDSDDDSEVLNTEGGAHDRHKRDTLDKGVAKYLKSAMKAVGPAPSHTSDGAVQGSHIDLRHTNCFTKTIAQGPCGSCYALAGVALYEYLYCRAYKTNVQFSAQYIVDCGHPFGMLGCGGGTFSQVTQFAKAMGFELGYEYPYVGHSSRGCPYAGVNSDGSSPGFIRAASDDFIKADYSDWKHWLRKKVPLYIGIGYGQSFLDYGGGVHDNTDCDEESHAVVLVGMGVENGQKYWLIRNSFGSYWGINGYYKLNKNSRCLHKHKGGLAPDGLRRHSKSSFKSSKGRKMPSMGTSIATNAGTSSGGNVASTGASGGSSEGGRGNNAGGGGGGGNGFLDDFDIDVEPVNRPEPAKQPKVPVSHPTEPIKQQPPPPPPAPKPEPAPAPAPAPAPVKRYEEPIEYKPAIEYIDYSKPTPYDRYNSYNDEGAQIYYYDPYDRTPKEDPYAWKYDPRLGYETRLVQDSWGGWW